MTLVARSAPSPTRPRLADHHEEVLHETDAARAACYASMEDLSDRCEVIAEIIDEVTGPVHFAIPRSGTPEAEELHAALEALRPKS